MMLGVIPAVPTFLYKAVGKRAYIKDATRCARSRTRRARRVRRRVRHAGWPCACAFPVTGRMRRVLLAYLLCDLIEFATWMAVVLVAYSRGGATAVGIASVAMLLPAILIVPLIAGFGDRMPRGRRSAVLAPLAIVVLGPSRAFIPIGLLVILTGLVTHVTVRALEATSTVRAARSSCCPGCRS